MVNGTASIPTLDEILSSNPDDFVSKYRDIAAINLACAVGLPGTECLDVTTCMATLAQWTARIALLTQRYLHRFQQLRSEFENSEPLWRICCIARVLEQQCGVHYCPEERNNSGPADWRKSDRHLVHGLLGPQRHGTCASLPVLLVAIARRLGYPMKLVQSPGHIFTRWDGLEHPNPAWRERRNLEFSGGLDSHPDEHYHNSPVEWTPELHASERVRSLPLFLRSLTPAEEVASFLAQRGHALEGCELFSPAWAVYAAACRFAPHNDSYCFYAKQCHRRHLDHVLKRWGLTGSHFCRLIEMRLHGSAIVPFPWETATGERIPDINPYCDSNTAAPLIAAERAVAARIAGALKGPAVPAAASGVKRSQGPSPSVPTASAIAAPYVFSAIVSSDIRAHSIR